MNREVCHEHAKQNCIECEKPMKLKTVRAPSPAINVILDKYIDKIHATGFYGRTKSETVMWLLSDSVKQKVLDGVIAPVQFHPSFTVDED